MKTLAIQSLAWAMALAIMLIAYLSVVGMGS